MTLFRIVYVSSALLPPGQEDDEVTRIVERAVIANGAHNITGALIYDGSRFAQVIEGPETVTRALCDRILADPRHADPVILEQTPAGRRLFDGFSLAYRGRSVYVERTLARPLRADEARGGPALSQLITMMREFAR